MSRPIATPIALPPQELHPIRIFGTGVDASGFCHGGHDDRVASLSAKMRRAISTVVVTRSFEHIGFMGALEFAAGRAPDAINRRAGALNADA